MRHTFAAPFAPKPCDDGKVTKQHRPERPSTPSRLTPPARIVLALLALALGVSLIFAPISLPLFAVLCGVGMAISGVVLAFEPLPTPRRWQRVLTRVGGAAFVVFGVIIAVWPSLGVPALAQLIGWGLIVYGTLTAALAVRREADHRTATIIVGVTTVLLGVLSFTWPVLTLLLTRVGFGAWLVFIGAQLIVSIAFRRHSKTPDQTPAVQQPQQAQQPRHSHRWLHTLTASVALIVVALAAIGSHSLLSGDVRPLPGPFYAAPAEVPAQPGQLLRSEALTEGVPAGAQAWKILYTTTHPDGSPAISSGVAIAPAQRTEAPLPLLTVAHGTTGVIAQCAPSLSATPFADGAGTALAEMVTTHGWAGVISDYIGLGTAGTHPYLVGEAEARNVLDASRAASQIDGLTLSTETVVWGHSQGGQASLWTGQIAHTYAPEFTVKGIAAFAPASDLYGLANADKSEAAGKTVSAYIASTWNEIYPELQLLNHLTPGSSAGVTQITELCFNEKDALAAVLRGTQVPNQIFPDALLQGGLGDRLHENSPTGPFPAPVLVAQGLADPLVKPQLQGDWVAARCAAGEPIDFRTYPGLGHVDLVAADSPLTPQIVQWTLDRWNDAPPTPNCDKLPQT